MMCQEVDCYSYQYGDKVSLLVKTTKASQSSSSTNVDTLRRHMPTFGYDSTAKMNLLEFTNSDDDKKIISFNELEYVSFSVGPRHLPLIHIRDEHGKTLNEVIFKITYTVTDNDYGGEILSVSTESKYYNEDKNDSHDGDHHGVFTLSYSWIETPKLDERSGVVFMTTLTVIVFLITFQRSCNTIDTLDDDDDNYDSDFCEDEKYLVQGKAFNIRKEK